jgi:hypothetical protein
MENNDSRIDWSYLCENPVAVELLRENIQSGYDIDWWYLSKNPAAIDLLRENIQSGYNDINWNYLSENNNIFILTMIF